MNSIFDTYFGNFLYVFLGIILELLFIRACAPFLNRILEPDGNPSKKVSISYRFIIVMLILFLIFACTLYPPVFFTKVFVYSVPIALAWTPMFLKFISRQLQEKKINHHQKIQQLLTPQIISFVSIIFLNGVLDSSSGNLKEFKVMTKFEQFSRNRDQCNSRVEYPDDNLFKYKTAKFSVPSSLCQSLDSEESFVHITIYAGAFGIEWASLDPRLISFSYMRRKLIN